MKRFATGKNTSCFGYMSFSFYMRVDFKNTSCFEYMNPALYMKVDLEIYLRKIYIFEI